MNLLKLSTLNELVKLLARKKTSFFLLLSALLPFIGLPIIMKLQSGLGIMATSNVQYPITILNMLTLIVLPLMMFMSVSDIFSGEFGDKTIRSVLVRPVSRLKIFSSKLLAMFVLIVGQLLLGWMGSVLASLFLPASANMIGGLADAALAYAVAALPMFVLCTVTAFITQFFRNASGAMAICIMLYAAAKLITILFPQFTVFSPTSYTDWHQLWIGSVISIEKVTTIFSLLLGCGIVFYTTGYYFFDKKEA
jgi:ABC-2 type transport system permease protein